MPLWLPRGELFKGLRVKEGKLEEKTIVLIFMKDDWVRVDSEDGEK